MTRGKGGPGVRASARCWGRAMLAAPLALVVVGCGAAPRSAAPPAHRTHHRAPPAHTAANSNTAAIAAGAQLFRHVCYYCHGPRGQGDNNNSGAPALWGPNSPLVADPSLVGSLDTLAGLTAFIHQNMPLAPVNGIKAAGLTLQQAHDAAEFIRHQDHRS